MIVIQYLFKKNLCNEQYLFFELVGVMSVPKEYKMVV